MASSSLCHAWFSNVLHSNCYKKYSLYVCLLCCIYMYCMAIKLIHCHCHCHMTSKPERQWHTLYFQLGRLVYDKSWHTIFLLVYLTLNVPVPHKYGTHQCVEPRFHALEPHLSRTSRALPTRIPRTRAAVRRRPRNSHSHASRGSVHFHAFAGRNSAHFHAIRSRNSAHFHAIRSRRSANFDGSISHAFPRIPAQW